MMSSSSSLKTLLTYPPPGYARLWIYIFLAVLAYAYIVFAPKAWLNPPDMHAGPRGATPFAWWLLIPITVFGFSLFLAIFEGLFLIGRKINPVCLEFDSDNLYINDSKGERAIPLTDIVSIRMIYGQGIFDVGRSVLYRYSIGFGDPYNPEQVSFTVFMRTGRAFSKFCNLVKEKNPAVQIKDWATSLDGIGRWFKNRNSGAKQDEL
jgi:hypothetical protein